MSKWQVVQAVNLAILVIGYGLAVGAAYWLGKNWRDR